MFKEIYSTIVGDEFEKNFVYAKKYDKLTVLKQFIPYYYLDGTNSENVLTAYKQLESVQTTKYGVNHVVVGNRFPSNGYLLIDQHLFDEFGIEWNTHNIIRELISTVFDNLGFVEQPVFTDK